MRAGRLAGDEPAFEAGGGVLQERRTEAAGVPGGAREVVRAALAGAAGECVGDGDLGVRQRVDGEDAVGLDGRDDRRAPLDAGEQHGRIGRDRAHGADREAEAPGLALGRDDVDAGHGRAHGVDERGARRLGIEGVCHADTSAPRRASRRTARAMVTAGTVAWTVLRGGDARRAWRAMSCPVAWARALWICGPSMASGGPSMASA